MATTELLNFRHQLLAEPSNQLGRGEHFVQFYQSPLYLAQSIAQFMATGLKRGEGAIIIAKAENMPLVKAALTAEGLDIDHYQSGRQLIILDAAKTLEMLMTNHLPDSEKFHAVIGNQIATMAKEYSHIRAFGEMVGVLWDKGNKEATILLEELWNELALDFNFSLMCGYALKSFDQGHHTEGFEQICQAHGQCLPTEQILYPQAATSHLLQISVLEQQALALRESLRARDELISNCGHELKTPLTSLRLLSNISKRKIKEADPSFYLPEQIEKTMDKYEKQIERLISVVDGMLDLSKITSGKLDLYLEEINLSEVIYEVVEKFSAELQAAGCELALNLSPAISGQWDKFRLEQVMTNLLSNAIKYGRQQPIEITTYQDHGKKVVITVQDHGIGIAKKYHHKIFQRFERVDPDREVSGLGLGLYISQQIINSMAGSICIESSPGAGAIFKIELPL